MTGFLLDTNVVSETRRRRPHPAVVDWLETAQGPLFLSVVVVGELTRGVALLQSIDEPRARALDGWLGGLLRDYRDRILPVSLQVAQRWGQMGATGQIPVADGLLAATAAVHDLTLVTRNVKHVAPTGVDLLNPFRD